MKISTLRKSVVSVLCVGLVNLGFVGAAGAGVVETGALVTSAREADLGVIREQLQRQDVQQRLQELGVDAVHVQTRLANLSDWELRQLATDIENAPAGGDLLAVVGVVFVILVILEFAGVIDIFKRAP